MLALLRRIWTWLLGLFGARARGTGLGNCYESANCTPAGNGMPGSPMTRADCKTAGGQSWRELDSRGREIGSCIAP